MSFIKSKKRTVIIFVSLLFFLCTAWMIKGSIQANKLLSLGEKYLGEKSYEEAVLAFNESMQIRSRNPDTYFGLIDAYIGHGDLDSATKVLHDCLNTLPNSKKLMENIETAYLNLAFAYKKVNRDQTITILNEALEKTYSVEIKDALIKEQYSIGENVLIEGDYDTAIKAFCDVLDLDFTCELAYHGLAEAYLGKGERDSAIAIYQSGLRVYWANEYMSLKLAEIYVDLNDYDSAIEVLELAVQYNSSNKLRNTLDTLKKLNPPGNSTGNLSGKGKMASDTDWIYFSGDGLYKIRKDGTERTKIDDHSALQINVIGDWIYYIAEDSLTIYKIRTDGTEKTILLHDVKCKSLTAVGNWLYYTASSDYGIFKISTDGTNLKRICDDSPFDMSVKDGWIYYTADQLTLHKMRVDGTEKWIYLYRPHGHITVIGDLIYISNYNKLYRVDTDISEKIRISDDEIITGLNGTDDWIYYARKKDESQEESTPREWTNTSTILDDEFEIFKITPYGGKKTKVLNQNAELYVIDNMIYYYYPDGIYRMTQDGSVHQFFTTY